MAVRLFREEFTEQVHAPVVGRVAQAVGSEEAVVAVLAAVAVLLEEAAQAEAGNFFKKQSILTCTLKNSSIFYKLHTRLENYLPILIIIKGEKKYGD